ncbi:hypothetical protein [Nocardia sp. NPDC051463]|uniref:hypothetical protein n=1 Tax=Nocardia sp. NPDC051463 TaxID=3154845 RepID=UPI00344F547E
MSEIRIGTLLRGFCHGAFGRDSYDDKRVEAIGADWVVVRETGGAVLLYGGSAEELAAFTPIGCYCMNCRDTQTEKADD